MTSGVTILLLTSRVVPCAQFAELRERQSLLDRAEPIRSRYVRSTSDSDRIGAPQRTANAGHWPPFIRSPHRRGRGSRAREKGLRLVVLAQTGSESRFSLMRRRGPLLRAQSNSRCR